MTRQVSGPCIRAACEETAGHGSSNILCEAHAAEAAASAAEIIQVAAPQAMMMHQGQPAQLPCDHVANAGDHVVSIGGNWVCADCATGR